MNDKEKEILQALGYYPCAYLGQLDFGFNIPTHYRWNYETKILECCFGCEKWTTSDFNRSKKRTVYPEEWKKIKKFAKDRDIDLI